MYSHKTGKRTHHIISALFIQDEDGSGLFLEITLDFEEGAQFLEREVAGGEVHGDEPGGDEVDEVVEEVGVGDAVDGGVEGEGEEQGGG